MSQGSQQNDVTKRRVVYQLPGMNEVRIRRDVEYRVTDSEPLTMDIYYPPPATDSMTIPAVIIIAGYPDQGFRKMLGCKFKEMASSISWGQLLAASGLVAITYTNREPEEDIEGLFQYIRRNASALGIDAERIGLLASSGNVPVALSVLMREDREFLKCAALCYGYMLDCDSSTVVAEAASMFKFVNPCTGKSAGDLPHDLPLFIVRAGQDQLPRLNETIDLFLAEALACNLSITLVNHAAAPHAFDLLLDSPLTCDLIKQMLGFMQFHLLA